MYSLLPSLFVCLCVGGVGGGGRGDGGDSGSRSYDMSLGSHPLPVSPPPSSVYPRLFFTAADVSNTLTLNTVEYKYIQGQFILYYVHITAVLRVVHDAVNKKNLNTTFFITSNNHRIEPTTPSCLDFSGKWFDSFTVDGFFTFFLNYFSSIFFHSSTTTSCRSLTFY